MRLLLSTSSSNEDYTGGCDYGVVDLTPQLAARHIKLIDQFNELKKTEADLHEMYFWNSAADFIDPYKDDKDDDCSFSETVQPVLEAINDFVEIPAELEIPGLCFARTECNQSIVRSDAVAFFCYPKHSDIEITTHEIDVKTLQEIAGTVAVEGLA